MRIPPPTKTDSIRIKVSKSTHSYEANETPAAFHQTICVFGFNSNFNYHPNLVKPCQTKQLHPKFLASTLGFLGWNLSKTCCVLNFHARWRKGKGHETSPLDGVNTILQKGRFVKRAIPSFPGRRTKTIKPWKKAWGITSWQGPKFLKHVFLFNYLAWGLWCPAVEFLRFERTHFHPDRLKPFGMQVWMN